MNKQKIKEIVKFSLRKNIQNKWFVILNCLLFIITVIALNTNNINLFLEEKNINLFNDEIKIEYIDSENLIGNSLEKAFDEYEKIEVLKITENNYTADNIENNIVVEVFSSQENILEAKIISKEGIDNGIYNTIVETLNTIRTEIFSKQNNIKKDELENLEKGTLIERIMLGVDSENSEKKETIEYISTIMMYMISIFIFSKIANDIAQEKASKSIEYVLTSVSAKEYLLAKIISIVLVVLLQGIYLLVYFCIANLINSIINMSYLTDLESIPSVLSNIDINLIKYILVVFIYGVLTIVLMSIIQAALSSKTTGMQEAGNSMMFLLTITIAVYILTFVLITPYTNMSWWIYVLSCIPLISNFFIPAIIIIGQATFLQIIVSLVLLILSIPITFNICSKIFKNGVLDYKQSRNKKRKAKKDISLLEEQEIKLEKAKFKKLGFVVGLAVILFIILSIIADFLLELFVVPVISNYVNEAAVNLIFQIIVSGVGLGIASYFVHLYIVKQDKGEAIDKKASRKLFIISLSLIGILQIVLVFIEMWLGIENSASELLLDIDGLNNPLNCVLFLIEIAIMPAIFEELFFRKSLIDLSRNFGEKFAVVFSSLVFAVSHLNFSQAIFAFLMGLVLGTLYVKTKSMKYNCLLHFFNNGYAAIGEILLFNNLELSAYIFEITILVVIAFSVLILIVELLKKIQKRETINWLEGKIIPKNFKYILTDYTVIISIVFIVLLFTTTEIILGI